MTSVLPDVKYCPVLFPTSIFLFLNTGGQCSNPKYTVARVLQSWVCKIWLDTADSLYIILLYIVLHQFTTTPENKEMEEQRVKDGWSIKQKLWHNEWSVVGAIVVCRSASRSGCEKEASKYSWWNSAVMENFPFNFHTSPWQMNNNVHCLFLH